MASIKKERNIDASPEAVWDALRDWGVLHERLARGYVTDSRVEDRDRVITFFNGFVVRERIVEVDERERRLVWSIVEGPYSHHNGAAQVFTTGEGRARFVWTADLLPDELAEPTAEMMERGLDAMKATLEGTTDA